MSEDDHLQHDSIDASQEDDWSMDEEYELVHDGIDATDAQTDADREQISSYIRPDLLDAQGNPINVQTRLNEEFVLMNGDILSYNTVPFNYPERTRIISIGQYSAWALECDADAFSDGRDHPLKPGEVDYYNNCELNLLWRRLESMTLRLQIDEFTKMIKSKRLVDPDHADEYEAMLGEAELRRQDMPEKTDEEKARHPRAMQHARALLGIPKERTEHPALGMTRLEHVSRAAYDRAVEQSKGLLHRLQDEYKTVQKAESVAKKAYGAFIDANSGKAKGWKKLHDRYALHQHRREALEQAIPRLEADAAACVPLHGESFPDAYNHRHEAGVVFEYTDEDGVVRKRGKRGKRARPKWDPRKPDARDDCYRRLVFAKMGGQFPKWRYAKQRALGLVCANGAVVQGQFTTVDGASNPASLSDRLLIAEQFLDYAWPNRWGQPVWTTRIQVRMANDLMRTKGSTMASTPVYYVRDLTHTLGRVKSVDLASPKQGRERLMLVRFEGQIVVIQPQDLVAAHQAAAKARQSEASEASDTGGDPRCGGDPSRGDGSGTATAGSGTETGDSDFDALIAQAIDGTLSDSNGRSKHRKKKKKKKRKKPKKKQSASSKAPVEESTNDLNPVDEHFDALDDLPEDKRDQDIMLGLQDAKEMENPMDLLKNAKKWDPKRDLVWAHGAAIELRWSATEEPNSHYARKDPVVTAACIDNTMDRCEVIYIGSYHGCVYKILWRVGECINCDQTPQPTPILDLHMQTPHLIARTISDVLMFHGTENIRPFQTDTGLCAGAYVCGALMMLLAQSGNAWLTNVHATGAVRNFVPTKDLWVDDGPDQMIKELLEKQKKEREDDPTGVPEGGITATKQSVIDALTHALIGEDPKPEEEDAPKEEEIKQEKAKESEETGPEEAKDPEEEDGPNEEKEKGEDEEEEDEFALADGEFKEESFEDTGIQTEVGRDPEQEEVYNSDRKLAVPITYMYRGTHMMRKEIRVLYPCGVIRRMPIREGQERALEAARARQRQRELDVLAQGQEEQDEEEGEIIAE